MASCIEQVAYFERVDVLGRVAVVVPLDEKGKNALFVRLGDGCVWADDGLALGVLESLRV